jgi:hypothetical protein
VKRFLLSLIVLAFAAAGIHAGEAKKADVTWSWKRTDVGILITVNVQDPDVIEVRGWAVSDSYLSGGAVMVYGPGMPTAIGMAWPANSTPLKIWIEVIKAVGVQNSPAENQLYGTDTDPDAVGQAVE